MAAALWSAWLPLSIAWLFGPLSFWASIGGLGAWFTLIVVVWRTSVEEIVQRWAAGQSTWWLADGAIASGTVRPHAHLRSLMTTGATMLALAIVACTALVVAGTRSDDAARGDATSALSDGPYEVIDPDGPGGNAPVILRDPNGAPVVSGSSGGSEARAGNGSSNTASPGPPRVGWMIGPIVAVVVLSTTWLRKRRVLR